MTRLGRGLSPHTRGNRSHGGCRSGLVGSIPAHTGEPGCQPRRLRGLRVYPRTHGGTEINLADAGSGRGLSPHTRGNLDCFGSSSIRSGSIPAHTGEPRDIPTRIHVSRVYPRTHGGTSLEIGDIRAPPGLSPHTRGNRRLLEIRPECRGSIPAHTGEPDCAESVP